MRSATVEELAELITKGTTPTTLGMQFSDSGIPFLRAQNLVDGTVSVEADPLYIDADTHSALRRSKIHPKDVLISIAGTIGRASVVPDNAVEMNCNQAVAIVRTNERISNRYLLHWLSSQDARSQIARSSVTGTISNLSLSQIAALKVPLPPLEEQRRIAAILDAADALRAKRRAALAKLDTLAQSIFVEMFGDPALEVDRWPAVSLEDFAALKDDIKCGPFGTQLLQSEFVEEGVPLWGIKQVNKGFKIPTHEFVTAKKARELSSYSILPFDIVMTRKGTIGNCAVYPSSFPPGVMHSDLLRLRVDARRHNPIFIADQLRFNRSFIYQLTLISGGAIMAGINVTRLKQLEAIAPPKALQDTYADRINAIDSGHASLACSEAKLDALFVSLQHRAFRGELTSADEKVAAA